MIRLNAVISHNRLIHSLLLALKWGILNPLSWADWLIRFWLVESGHVTTKRISRLMRSSYRWNLQVGKSQILKRNPCMYYVDGAMRYHLKCMCRVTIAAFLSLWYLYFFAIYYTFTWFEFFTTLISQNMNTSRPDQPSLRRTVDQRSAS